GVGQRSVARGAARSAAGRSRLAQTRARDPRAARAIPEHLDGRCRDFVQLRRGAGRARAELDAQEWARVGPPPGARTQAFGTTLLGRRFALRRRAFCTRVVDARARLASAVRIPRTAKEPRRYVEARALRPAAHWGLPPGPLC